MTQESSGATNHDCRLNSFLNDNLPIITIIGVFGALSFFSINSTDQDLVTISVLLSIIVIFLFIWLLVDGIIRIFYEIKDNFRSENLFEYIAKCKHAFGLVAFLAALSLLIWALITYLNLHTEIYFRILLLMLIIFIDVAISVITIPYIVFKENQLSRLGIMWLLSTVIIMIGSWIIGIIPPSRATPFTPNDLISVKGFVVMLLIVPMLFWLVTFFKGIFLASAEKK